MLESLSKRHRNNSGNSRFFYPYSGNFRIYYPISVPFNLFQERTPPNSRMNFNNAPNRVKIVNSNPRKALILPGQLTKFPGGKEIQKSSQVSKWKLFTSDTSQFCIDFSERFFYSAFKILTSIQYLNKIPIIL